MNEQNQSVNTVNNKITCPLEEEHRLLMRVMHGDKETGEMGQIEMVKEIYSILTSAKNLIKFMDKFGTFIKWVAGIGLAIAILKGWAAGLLLSLIGK